MTGSIAPPSVVGYDRQHLSSSAREFRGKRAKILFPADWSANSRKIRSCLKNAPLALGGQGTACSAEAKGKVAQNAVEQATKGHGLHPNNQLGFMIDLQRQARPSKDRRIGVGHRPAIVNGSGGRVLGFWAMQPVGRGAKDHCPTLAKNRFKGDERRPV